MPKSMAHVISFQSLYILSLLVVGRMVEWAGVMVGPWLHRRQEEAHEAGY